MQTGSEVKLKCRPGPDPGPGFDGPAGLYIRVYLMHSVRTRKRFITGNVPL